MLRYLETGKSEVKEKSLFADLRVQIINWLLVSYNEIARYLACLCLADFQLAHSFTQPKAVHCAPRRSSQTAICCQPYHPPIHPSIPSQESSHHFQ